MVAVSQVVAGKSNFIQNIPKYLLHASGAFLSSPYFNPFLHNVVKWANIL